VGIKCSQYSNNWKFNWSVIQELNDAVSSTDEIASYCRMITEKLSWNYMEWNSQIQGVGVGGTTAPVFAGSDSQNCEEQICLDFYGIRSLAGYSSTFSLEVKHDLIHTFFRLISFTDRDSDKPAREWNPSGRWQLFMCRFLTSTFSYRFLHSESNGAT